MCGIVGILGSSLHNGKELKSMLDALRHRGPDSGGCWVDDNYGIALGHRRLSIVDLSPAGAQPMKSVSNRYVLSFNGEIYNHKHLRSIMEREKLLVGPWRGHSDTETLLAGFDCWGIEGTLQRTVGMFALAIWDQSQHVLTLVRDRMGEKPLYYGWQGEDFLFGSELKALKRHTSFSGVINRGAISLYMRHSVVPTPYSIYEGIYKLKPGHILRVSRHDRNTISKPYWEVKSVVSDGLLHRYKGTAEEAVGELEGLLKGSIAQQMVADVPLGAFLSGGIDSTTIVALMQAQSSRPIRTFTIGFNESGYNEAAHAKAISDYLGTEHEELYVSPKQALTVIPKLPTVYCEPFADSSQIPTYLISQLAHQYVTVSLSGDGGDELFGGYNRYVLGKRLWGGLSNVPLNVRRQLAKLVCVVSPDKWNRTIGHVQGILPSKYALANIGDKIHKGASVLAASTAEEMYHLLVSHWDRLDNLVVGAVELPTVLTDQSQKPHTDNFVHQMMAMDMLTYLPDDILTKLDRAAMGVSLETRVPFLDHRIVEFAWRLPLNYKIHAGVGKWPLRKLLYKYVPKEMMERPKMGFGIPIGSWLRGPLKEWAEELLNESRLKSEGYLNPQPIRKKWSEHISGQRNWQHHLWDVLMFQAWLEAQ